MRVKCNCFNCSRHLEFETKDAGASITCPSCGMETRLYIPTGTNTAPSPQTSAAAEPSAPKIAASLRPVNAPTAQQKEEVVLAKVREGTAYKELREFISIGVALGRVLAGIFCLLVLTNTAFAILTSPPAPNTWYHALAGSVALAGIFVAPFALLRWVFRTNLEHQTKLAQQVALAGSIVSGFVFVASRFVFKLESIPSWLAQWHLLPVALAGCLLFCLVVEFLLRVTKQSLLVVVDLADSNLFMAARLERLCEKDLKPPAPVSGK